MKYNKETRRFHSPLTGGVLTEPLAAKLFFGLVSGLQYLHAKRVCHRDIKVSRSALVCGKQQRPRTHTHIHTRRTCIHPSMK